MYESISVETILLEITNVCNMNCVHCFNSKDRDVRAPVFITISQISDIIKICNKYNLDKLYISGGEPFTHPQIEEILDLCSIHEDVMFIITTNGLLITPEHIRKIEQHDNIGIQISVDGFSKTAYESQRGVGEYDKFWEILQNLIKSKIKFLTARTCITKLNVHEVADIYKYLFENKVAPSFLFPNMLGSAVDNWDSLSLSMAEMLGALDSINKLSNHYNYLVTPPETTAGCVFTENAAVKSLLIKYTGDIAPCQFFYNDSIGNIFDNKIEEILCYDNLKKYYEIANERKLHLSKSSSCLNCKIHEICGYGCVGLAQEKGDIMGLDGYCRYRLLVSACYSNRIVTMVRDELRYPKNENDKINTRTDAFM